MSDVRDRLGDSSNDDHNRLEPVEDLRDRLVETRNRDVQDLREKLGNRRIQELESMQFVVENEESRSYEANMRHLDSEGYEGNLEIGRRFRHEPELEQEEQRHGAISPEIVRPMPGLFDGLFGSDGELWPLDSLLPDQAYPGEPDYFETFAKRKVWRRNFRSRLRKAHFMKSKENKVQRTKHEASSSATDSSLPIALGGEDPFSTANNGQSKAHGNEQEGSHGHFRDFMADRRESSLERRRKTSMFHDFMVQNPDLSPSRVTHDPFLEELRNNGKKRSTSKSKSRSQIHGASKKRSRSPRRKRSPLERRRRPPQRRSLSPRDRGTHLRSLPHERSLSPFRKSLSPLPRLRSLSPLARFSPLPRSPRLRSRSPIARIFGLTGGPQWSPQRRFSGSPPRRFSGSPPRRFSRSPPRRFSRSPLLRQFSRSPSPRRFSPVRRIPPPLLSTAMGPTPINFNHFEQGSFPRPPMGTVGYGPMPGPPPFFPAGHLQGPPGSAPRFTNPPRKQSRPHSAQQKPIRRAPPPLLSFEPGPPPPEGQHHPLPPRNMARMPSPEYRPVSPHYRPTSPGYRSTGAFFGDGPRMRSRSPERRPPRDWEQQPPQPPTHGHRLPSPVGAVRVPAMPVEPLPLNLQPQEVRYGSPANVPVYFCPCCTSEHHKLQNCTNFIEMTHQRRWEVIKRSNNICSRCLGSGHKVLDCQSDQFCLVEACHRPHHTLLHSTTRIKKEVVDLVSDDEDNGPPFGHGEPDVTCTLCKRPGHYISQCSKFFCFKCEKRGHFAKDCNLQDSPKVECMYCHHEGHSINRCPLIKCRRCHQIGHTDAVCDDEPVLALGTPGFGHHQDIITCNYCGKQGHHAQMCSDVTCFNCRKKGHWAKDCKNPYKEKELICFNCNIKGHHIQKCPFIECKKCGGTGHWDRNCQNQPNEFRTAASKKKKKQQQYAQNQASSSMTIDYHHLGGVGASDTTVPPRPQASMLGFFCEQLLTQGRSMVLADEMVKTWSLAGHNEVSLYDLMRNNRPPTRTQLRLMLVKELANVPSGSLPMSVQISELLDKTVDFYMPNDRINMLEAKLASTSNSQVPPMLGLPSTSEGPSTSRDIRLPTRNVSEIQQNQQTAGAMDKLKKLSAMIDAEVAGESEAKTALEGRMDNLEPLRIYMVDKMRNVANQFGVSDSYIQLSSLTIIKLLASLGFSLYTMRRHLSTFGSPSLAEQITEKVRNYESNFPAGINSKYIVTFALDFLESST